MYFQEHRRKTVLFFAVNSDIIQSNGSGVVSEPAVEYIGAEIKALSERNNIVVVADEAHRSQYDFIDGDWLTTGDYYVIHRFATLPKYQREGFARIFINKVNSLCEVEKVPSIKVDTNFDNGAMLHILNKLGYTYCGEVYFRGSARKAFEKLLK